MKHKILQLATSEKGSINKVTLSNVLQSTGVFEQVDSHPPNTGNLNEQFYWWYHELSEYPRKCQVCNMPLTIFKNFKIEYTQYSTCSRLCAARHPDRINKIKTTNVERYGGTTPISSPKVKEKIKQTTLLRYGFTSVLHLPQVKEGLKSKFNITENISQSDYWKTKTKETFKYNSGYAFSPGEPANQTAIESLKEELALSGDFTFHQLAAWKRDGAHLVQLGVVRGFEVLSHDYSVDSITVQHTCGEIQTSPIKTKNIFRCLKCSPLKYSTFESSVWEFINSLGIESERNNRREIYPLELDLYLPEFKLAIECNGDYWHSFNREETCDERNKHLTKLEMCINSGIDLIQITEHEWNHKCAHIKSIVKARVNKCTKLYARKLSSGEITAEEAEQFFVENSVAFEEGGQLSFGLFNDSRLVAAISARCVNRTDWELLQFANLQNTVTVGGLSKLGAILEERLSQIGVTSIRVNINRRLFSGLGLQKTGWKQIAVLPPASWWWYNKQQIKNIKDSNMFDLGARRLWDCGQYQFIKIYN